MSNDEKILVNWYRVPQAYLQRGEENPIDENGKPGFTIGSCYVCPNHKCREPLHPNISEHVDTNLGKKRVCVCPKCLARIKIPPELS